MGIYNQSYKSTYNLLRGFRGLISTVISGVISTMNLQVSESEGSWDLRVGLASG